MYPHCCFPSSNGFIKCILEIYLDSVNYEKFNSCFYESVKPSFMKVLTHSSLKNRHFWCDSQFLALCTRPLGWILWIFRMDDLSIHDWKILKNGGNIKIFLESCKERSKLSVDGFWGLRDHLVAQKSNFKIFLC